jgi:uncharacterized protein (TIGR02246 family)
MTTTTAPTIEDTTVDHRADVAAIERVIGDVETAFNTNDPELMVEHLAQNATSVNVMGARLTGRGAVLESSRQGLAGFLRDQYARYEVADVTFLRPDVAVAHKDAWATTPDGEPLTLDHAMVALYVLVKEAGRWWIVARQNTVVPAAEDG